MGEKRAHITVRGIVQGVFFRKHTADEANRLGLTGWVRNTPEGSVEIIAEGNENQLKKLEKWCYKGPPSASVDKVEAEDEEPTGEFRTFKIKF